MGKLPPLDDHTRCDFTVDDRAALKALSDKVFKDAKIFEYDGIALPAGSKGSKKALNKAREAAKVGESLRVCLVAGLSRTPRHTVQHAHFVSHAERSEAPLVWWFVLLGMLDKKAERHGIEKGKALNRMPLYKELHDAFDNTEGAFFLSEEQLRMIIKALEEELGSTGQSAAKLIDAAPRAAADAEGNMSLEMTSSLEGECVIDPVIIIGTGLFRWQRLRRERKQESEELLKGWETTIDLTHYAAQLRSVDCAKTWNAVIGTRPQDLGPPPALIQGGHRRKFAV